MKARNFYNLPSVWQVECSGKSLAGSDTLSLSLIDVVKDHVLAFVDVGKGECFGSDVSSACSLYSQTSANTRLVTLITDLLCSEARVIGCNASSFRSGHITLQRWRMILERSCKL